MNKLKRKRLLKLIKEWTKSEVLARQGVGIAYAEFSMVMIEKEDEIRELLYGTSSLVELGRKFGLPVDTIKKKKIKRRN